MTVLDGTAQSDGYQWQHVQSGSVVGWAADIYLQPKADTVTASSVAPGPTLTPPPRMPSIVGGEAPPKRGGYALFVFSGGAYADLLQVAGCSTDTATFWATSADGQLAWYLPKATVAAVNAGWDKLFDGQIPPDTALLARCS